MKILIFLSLFTMTAFANFTHKSEVSAVSSIGNTNFATYNGSTKNKFDFTGYNVEFGGSYTSSTSGEDKIEIARIWNAFVQAGKYLRPNFDVFLRSVLESNRFESIDTRTNTDVGFTYIQIKEEDNYLSYQLAYRYAVEDTTTQVGSFYDNKAYAKIDYQNKFNGNMTYGAWLELITNLTRTKDYEASIAPFLTSKLTTNFSLKLQIKHKYDNVPGDETLKKHDTTFTTSFLANF